MAWSFSWSCRFDGSECFGLRKQIRVNLSHYTNKTDHNRLKDDFIMQLYALLIFCQQIFNMTHFEAWKYRVVVFFKTVKRLKIPCFHGIILTTTALFNAIDFQGIYVQQRGDISLLFVLLPSQLPSLLAGSCCDQCWNPKWEKIAYSPEPLTFQQNFIGDGRVRQQLAFKIPNI